MGKEIKCSHNNIIIPTFFIALIAVAALIVGLHNYTIIDNINNDVRPHYVYTSHEESTTNYINVSDTKGNWIYHDTPFIEVPENGTVACDANVVLDEKSVIWIKYINEQKPNTKTYLAELVNRSKNSICIVKWTVTVRTIE